MIWMSSGLKRVCMNAMKMSSGLKRVCMNAMKMKTSDELKRVCNSACVRG